MKKLFAFYEQKKIGALTQDDNDVYAFEYESSWTTDAEAFPISLSMPLDQNSFGNKISLSFFENLLPEGDVRKNLEKSHRIHGTFEFLARFGEDCAGAIILTKNDKAPPQSSTNQLVPLEMDKIYEAIEEKMPVADVIAEMNPGYLSLAGAQDKFPAVLKDQKFYLPKQGTPTTHIVKVPIQRMGIKDSVFNEYFCMELAREVEFEVPACQIVDGKHPLYIVDRYDRYLDKNGTVRRLHQQDLCQAQGYSSDNKYEINGGPSIKQNYDFLFQHLNIQNRLSDIESYLSWICFNLIIGNNDSHSKNLSILLTKDRKYRLAPLYDLVSTVIYPKLEKQFSFKIGDRNDFSTIGKNQIERLERSLEIKPGTFMQILRLVSEKVIQKKSLVAQRILTQFPAAKIVLRINDLLDDRIKSLRFQQAI